MRPHDSNDIDAALLPEVALIDAPEREKVRAQALARRNTLLLCQSTLRTSFHNEPSDMVRLFNKGLV